MSPRRLLLAAAGLLVLLCAWVGLWSPLALEGRAPDDGYTRLGGVVHVHTTASDGGGTPAEVVAEALSAGLSFLAITDHNLLDAKPLEGYQGPLLVLVGTEISTQSGHLLGLGLPDPAFRFSGDARDALEDVRDLGGYAFAAHPSSPLPAFRWTAWDEPGDWGLELVNGDSEWREAGWLRLARAVALYGLNNRYALLQSLTPPTETLARWDALLARRNVAGLAGADAHSRVPLGKNIQLRFPAYRSLFDLVRTWIVLDHPLRGEAEADARTVVEALHRGRSYVGVDGLAPAGGFSFVAEDGGRRWTMGDSVLPSPTLRLRAGGLLPRGAMVRLLRNGETIAEAPGGVERAVATEGVYRVEVRVPRWPVPWVLSNPIYVFTRSSSLVREAAADEPAREPAPPVARRLVDAFEGRTVFTPATDPSSAVSLPILDPHLGVEGSGAARLAFRLGLPDALHPHPYCALVDRTRRDLSGSQGLAFSIRGDGVYRIWVQVRDENPASGDEGTESWFASVRTSRDWRRVALPFARLRSIDKHTDGRLDLDKVRALVFVLDRGADKPGTKGTIWIDDVGVY